METLGHGGENSAAKECHFQNQIAFVKSMLKTKPSEELTEVMIRVEQFDNFVFDAVTEAFDCQVAQAAFDLKLSRQMLDHGVQEFRGHPEQRDWNPESLDGPGRSQSCIDDWPHGASYEQVQRIVDAQIAKFERVNP